MSDQVVTTDRPLPPWAPAFRHVVFADAIQPRRRVVNLAPAAAGEDAAGSPRPDLSDDEHEFLHWLFREAGLSLDHYRIATLQRRIPACLRALRTNHFGTARRVLQRSPHLLPVALSTMIMGVTSFLRDGPVFETLRTRVLPELAVGRRKLGVWCVGCSEGPEMYSVAMMLAEAGVLDRCHLLGTDCRGDAIKRAREGLYDHAALRGLPAALREKYFAPAGRGWQVRPSLRDRVHWRRADVLTLHEPGVWDMILCRNMAMYFAVEATLGLWPRLEASLRPGGVLVLGKAERPSGTRHLSLLSPCIYRRDRG